MTALSTPSVTTQQIALIHKAVQREYAGEEFAANRVICEAAIVALEHAVPSSVAASVDVTVVGERNGERFHYDDAHDPHCLVIFVENTESYAKVAQFTDTGIGDRRKLAYHVATQLALTEPVLLIETDTEDWPDFLDYDCEVGGEPVAS